MNSIAELQLLFDSNSIKTSYPERLLYAHDASAYRIVPQAIVYPSSISQIQKLFAWAHKYNIGLTMRAAGTSLSGQAIGDGIIVDCSRYWNNSTVNNQGKSVTVQPGIIAAHVNRQLQSYSVKIGPDPASINACMMGGILANNSSGMCCGIHHNSYHTVESLQCILPNGTYINTADTDADKHLLEHFPTLYHELIAIQTTILTSYALKDTIRSKYRIKNTVGYCLNAFLDEQKPSQILKRLMIGSEGTLGFIAEATLNTIPDLPYKSTSMLYFSTMEAACKAIPLLVDTNIAALEIMDRAALRSVENQKGAPDCIRYLPQDGTALLAEYHAKDHQELLDYLDGFTSIQNQLQVLLEPSFTSDEVQRALLWKIRKGMFPSVGAARARGTGIINEDIAVPIQCIEFMVKDLRLLFNRYHCNEAIIFGHAKDGNLHFVMSHRFDTDSDIASFGSFMDDLAAIVIGKYNGSLKAEHGTGRNIAPFVAYEWGDELYAIMKRLKVAFDPLNILNPGIIISDDPRAHIKHVKPFPEVDPSIDTCIECGYCESICPTKKSTITPRQRIILQREITLHDSKEIKQLLYDFAQYNAIDSCANDGLCSLACPVGIHTGTYIHKQKIHSINENKDIYHSLERESLSIHQRDKRIKQSLNIGRVAAHIFGNSFVSSMSALVSSVFSTPQWIGSLPKSWDYRSTLSLAPKDNCIYYLPSCTSRLFAKPDGEYISVPDLIMNLGTAAGITIHIPDDIEHRCCGMAYDSKGHTQAAIALQSEWTKQIPEYSPVLVDAMSCAYFSKEDPSHQILDLTDFLNMVLSKIPTYPVQGTVVIHPPCSTQYHEETQKLIAIAQQCAQTVIVPDSTGCCGFAGDHGFYHPEIPISACSAVKEEINTIDNVIGYYSANPTCEIGMTLGTQKQYKSLLYLVAKATRLL